MKALVKFARGDGNVELRDVPEPNPSPNQVKLEVAACGICGTDLHVLHDTFRNFPPVILGHEFCGRVVETGRDVTGIKLGERFAVLGASTVTCGRCAYCRSGEFMFCLSRRGMGHGVNGAFTRFVCARPDQLFALPDSLSDDEGAMVEPFAAAVHAAAEMTPLRAGDIALVSGPGTMGLFCLKLLVAQGIRAFVVGTTADRARLELARACGAAEVLDASQGDVAARVRDLTAGAGVDVAIECAGAAASARTCLDAVRPLGHVTQMGHFGRSVELNYDAVAFKQLRVVGSVGYTAATWTRAIRLLAEGTVRLQELITHRLPLDDWAKAFAACEDKSALKALLKP